MQSQNIAFHAPGHGKQLRPKESGTRCPKTVCNRPNHRYNLGALYPSGDENRIWSILYAPYHACRPNHCRSTIFQSRIYNATIAALKRLDYVLNEIISTDYKPMSALQTKVTVIVTLCLSSDLWQETSSSLWRITSRSPELLCHARMCLGTSESLISTLCHCLNAGKPYADCYNERHRIFDCSRLWTTPPDRASRALFRT